MKIALNSQFSKLETTVINPFIRIVSFIYIFGIRMNIWITICSISSVQWPVLSVQCSKCMYHKEYQKFQQWFKLNAGVTVSIKIQIESIYTKQQILLCSNVVGYCWPVNGPKCILWCHCQILNTLIINNINYTIHFLEDFILFCFKLKWNFLLLFTVQFHFNTNFDSSQFKVV